MPYEASPPQNISRDQDFPSQKFSAICFVIALRVI
jgi:hypothetical protein